MIGSTSSRHRRLLSAGMPRIEVDALTRSAVLRPCGSLEARRRRTRNALRPGSDGTVGATCNLPTPAQFKSSECVPRQCCSDCRLSQRRHLNTRPTDCISARPGALRAFDLPRSSDAGPSRGRRVRRATHQIGGRVCSRGCAEITVDRLPPGRGAPRNGPPRPRRTSRTAPDRLTPSQLSFQPPRLRCRNLIGPSAKNGWSATTAWHHSALDACSALHEELTLAGDEPMERLH